MKGTLNVQLKPTIFWFDCIVKYYITVSSTTFMLTQVSGWQYPKPISSRFCRRWTQSRHLFSSNRISFPNFEFAVRIAPAKHKAILPGPFFQALFKTLLPFDLLNMAWLILLTAYRHSPFYFSPANSTTSFVIHIFGYSNNWRFYYLSTFKW